MEELAPVRKPEGMETGQAGAPAEQTETSQPEAPAQAARPAKESENPGASYFKTVAAMMGVFIAVPALGFLVLFPLLMPLMAGTAFMFALLPLAFLAYYGAALYWFFRGGMYQKLIHKSMRYGMQRSRQVMKDTPEDVKREMNRQVMQSEQMQEFRKQLKGEIRREMREEAKRTGREGGGANIDN